MLFVSSNCSNLSNFFKSQVGNERKYRSVRHGNSSTQKVKLAYRILKVRGTKVT